MYLLFFGEYKQNPDFDEKTTLFPQRLLTLHVRSQVSEVAAVKVTFQHSRSTPLQEVSNLAKVAYSWLDERQTHNLSVTCPILYHSTTAHSKLKSSALCHRRQTSLY